MNLKKNLQKIQVRNIYDALIIQNNVNEILNLNLCNAKSSNNRK